MTTLKRTFDLETRTLKSKDRCYVGQVYDHISTTLEFSYNPINALTDENYTAYIMFDLYDDEGNIFVYGPGSGFDGKKFEIPREVTARITTQRLDYQLWLIKNRTEWDGRIESLGDTEYLFSSKDSLAFKPTTRCRSSCTPMPARPPQPCMEPSMLGWVNYLRDHCILTPVQVFYGTFADGTEGVTLQFPTYNEKNDQSLELHIPYLDSESKIDTQTFLRVVEEYNPDVTHDQIMTALCVQNLLDEKLDKSSVIESWDDVTAEGIEVLSAELAKATFDTKSDKEFPIPLWNPETYYRKSAVVTWDADLYIAEKAVLEDDSQTIFNFNQRPDIHPEFWSAITEFSILQDMVVKDYNLDVSDYKDYSVMAANLVRRNPIPPWSPNIRYNKDSVVVHKGVVYISQSDVENINHEPQVWIQDPAELSRLGCPYEDKSWWAPIRGAGNKDVDVSTYTAIIQPKPNIADEELTEEGYRYEVYHHFNTSNLFVQARTNNMCDPTQRIYLVDAKYDVTDRNKLVVYLSEPAPPEGLVISVTPGGGIEGDYAKRSYQALYEKDQPSGYAGLDAEGMVPTTRLHISNSMDSSMDNDRLATMAVARMLDRKIDASVKTKTERSEFGPWDAETQYHEGSVVCYQYTLFVSLQEVNVGNIPGMDSKMWREFPSNISAITIPRKTILFGNDTDTEYNLFHDMDTMNFVFSVRRNDSTHEYLYPRVFATDMDNVKVIVDKAPGDNGLVLNLMDCTMKRDVEDIEILQVDTPADTWTYDNTTGYPMLVWTYGPDGDDMSADVIQKDATGFRPITMSFRTEVSGTAVLAKAQKMITLDKSTTVIDLAAEGLDPNKLYLVQVYAEGDEGQASTEVVQRPGSGTITVSINDADDDGVPDMEGYIVLREATMYKTFSVEEEEVRITHNLNRRVGIQVYQDNGEIAGTIMSCDANEAWAYTAGYGGYMVIL